VAEAEGGLTKVRLASVTTVSSTPDGPPGGERRRELILERRLSSTEAALTRPQNTVAETPENSWLLFSDPEGRFHFLHPQEFKNDTRGISSSTNRFTLVCERTRPPDLVVLGFLEGDAPKPETAFQPMLDGYRDKGFEVLMGGSKPLPPEGWENRKAYRVEAVLTPPAAKDGAPASSSGQRIHIDGYVVLFGTNASVTATVYTSRDDVEELRKTVERILQHFQLGPPVLTGR
jgi:hypothetical protein